MAKKKKRIALSDSSSGSLGSLMDVLKQAGFRASENDEVELAEAEDVADVGQPRPLPQAEKIVIRKERKGRGGKTVTIVERLTGSQAELKRLAKQVRKALGCGSTVEDGSIVLQGDQVDRVKQWFEENKQATNGVKDVF